MKRLVAMLCLLAQSAGAECLPLGDLGYVLNVVRPWTVTIDGPEVMIASGGVTRTPSTIHLFPSVEASFPKHAELANGIGLSYVTSVKAADVSGGFEARLSGWFQGLPPLGVQCSTAGKDPDPEWCLAVLGSLRPAAEGCDAASAKLPPLELAACEAKGGRVGIAGLSGAEICVLPAPDAGKACGKASDCSAWCEAETRTCAPEMYPFGCRTFLNEEGEEVWICVD